MGTKLGRGMMRVGEVVLQLQRRTACGKGLLNCQCVCVREGAPELMGVEGGHGHKTLGNLPVSLGSQ